MKNKLTQAQRDNITGYSLIMPVVLIITLIGIVPVIITISYSFQYRVLTDPKDIHWVGLANYVKLFKTEMFWKSLKQTLIFAVLSMVGQLIMGFAGAILLNKNDKAVGITRTAVLIPWAIPGVITALMFSNIFNGPMGPINALLLKTGVVSAPISWLAKPKTAMAALVITDVWRGFPLVALMILAGLQTIPHSLYESASIDGANKVQQFFKITLPNIKGVLLVVLLFKTMNSLRVFDIVYGLTGGGPANSTSTLLFVGYQYLFKDMNYGLGSAMCTVITVLVFALSILYLSVMKSDD